MSVIPTPTVPVESPLVSFSNGPRTLYSFNDNWLSVWLNVHQDDAEDEWGNTDQIALKQIIDHVTDIWTVLYGTDRTSTGAGVAGVLTQMLNIVDTSEVKVNVGSTALSENLLRFDANNYLAPNKLALGGRFFADAAASGYSYISPTGFTTSASPLFSLVFDGLVSPGPERILLKLPTGASTSVAYTFTSTAFTLPASAGITGGAATFATVNASSLLATSSISVAPASAQNATVGGSSLVYTNNTLGVSAELSANLLSFKQGATNLFRIDSSTSNMVKLFGGNSESHRIEIGGFDNSDNQYVDFHFTNTMSIAPIAWRFTKYGLTAPSGVGIDASYFNGSSFRAGAFNSNNVGLSSNSVELKEDSSTRLKLYTVGGESSPYIQLGSNLHCHKGTYNNSRRLTIIAPPDSGVSEAGITIVNADNTANTRYFTTNYWSQGISIVKTDASVSPTTSTNYFTVAREGASTKLSADRLNIGPSILDITPSKLSLYVISGDPGGITITNNTTNLRAEVEAGIFELSKISPTTSMLKMMVTDDNLGDLVTITSPRTKIDCPWFEINAVEPGFLSRSSITLEQSASASPSSFRKSTLTSNSLKIEGNTAASYRYFNINYSQFSFVYSGDTLFSIGTNSMSGHLSVVFKKDRLPPQSSPISVSGEVYVDASGFLKLA